MEEKYKYELLQNVLTELQEREVLNGLVLAGSWCQYYYRILFDNAPEVPLVRTTDIDFLIPNPASFKKSIDVSGLLNNLGFDSDFDYNTGLVKFVHPDLEIQFLTPELGRAKDKPYEIKKLNVNAEGLTFMKMLQDFKFRMEHNGVSIWLPEPSAYVLHKLLINKKRKNLAKQAKDLGAAISIGELCLEFNEHKERLKSIFDYMPKKWQKTVSENVKEDSLELFNFLKPK